MLATSVTEVKCNEDKSTTGKLYPGLKDFVAWLEAGRRGSTAAWAR